MAKLGINTGSIPNDGTGDTLLAAALKINQNFDEIYNTFGDGTNITPNVSYSEISGVSTYANSSGISSYSSVSGISSYSSISGIATYAETSRITITDNGVVIGTAGTINFGDNLTVSPISAGVVTVTGAAGGGGGESYWVSTAAGIHTLSNVGIGTTIPRGRLQVGSGTTNTNEFIITNAGDVGIGTTIPDHFDGFSILTLDGKDYQYLGDTLSGGGNIVLKSKGNKTLDIYSYTDNIGGIGTATNIDLHYGLYIQQPSGTSVVSLTKSGNVGVGTTNPTRPLTVVGSGASLSQLYVTGVSTFNGNSVFGDNKKILLGNDGDFEIYFDSSNTILQNSNTNSAGDLYIRSDSTLIQNFTGSETLAQFNSNGAVSLYYDNLKKFETIGTGVTVTGTTFTNQLSISGIATIGPVATGTTSLYLGGPLKVGEIDISGGSNSVHVGQGAGRKNYNGGSGQQNTAVGWNALGVNQASNFNTAFGISALGALGDTQFNNYDENTAIGAYAGSSLLTGNANTFVGRSSGASITSGSRNTILGKYDGNQNGLDIRTSSNNVVLADGDGNIRFYANSGGNVGLGTTNPTSALTVNGSVTVNNGGVTLATNNPTIVGTSGTVGEIKQIGGAPFYYDGSAWREFVLSSGTPVTVPADTEWDNVVFRTTFDTDFTDAKFGVTPSYSTGASITSAAVKVGTASLRLQNQYLEYPHRSEYDFTGEWTIEGWFYWDTLPSGAGTSGDCIISKYNPTFTGSNFMIGAEVALVGYVNFYWKNNVSSSHNATSGTLLAQYTSNEIFQKWNHIAVVREPLDGSIHFYLNGVEHPSTISNNIIDNDIANSSSHNLALGYYQAGADSRNFDGYVDDFRISTVARYTSTFTPPTTALPTTGTLSSYIQPPGDKYGEIGLGTSPTWRGTSGVTVSQQSSGNYRVSFASSYTNANDYFVLTQAMDQGFASYVGVARSTTHVDFAINKESDNTAVNTGSLSVQIKNHI